MILSADRGARTTASHEEGWCTALCPTASHRQIRCTHEFIRLRHRACCTAVGHSSVCHCGARSLVFEWSPVPGLIAHKCGALPLTKTSLEHPKAAPARGCPPPPYLLRGALLGLAPLQPHLLAAFRDRRVLWGRWAGLGGRCSTVHRMRVRRGRLQWCQFGRCGTVARTKVQCLPGARLLQQAQAPMHHWEHGAKAVHCLMHRPPPQPSTSTPTQTWR